MRIRKIIHRIYWNKKQMGHVSFCSGKSKNERAELLYPRREAGILWIHRRRPRPQRFLVSDLQSTFLSGFLSYLAGGLIW